MYHTNYKTSNDLIKNTLQVDKQGRKQNREQGSEKNNGNSSEKILNMKWETLQYEDSGNPEVWGPCFWFILHNSSVRYPEKATNIWKERMKGFILGIPVMLPCEKCAIHATAYIEKNKEKLDQIVSNRENLFNFFVDFHNHVNRRHGKPEMSYKNAYNLYTRKTNVSKLVYK